MTFHAKTVEQCWRLARRHAQLYQRKINALEDQQRDMNQAVRCRAARDAADRIALAIRYGTQARRLKQSRRTK